MFVIRKKEIFHDRVDTRGLPCPRPVIETKKALERSGSDSILVIADRKESCENVERFARSQNCEVSTAEKDGLFNIIIKPSGAIKQNKESAYVVLITSSLFGDGEEKLGEILMKSFLNTLWDSNPKPARIILINDGVHLTVEGSEVLDALKLLENDGVEIFSCGTCLEYYKLKDKLQVGLISNMYDIVNSLLESGKVIKI
jgi:selenium metabolism protein YedF